MKVSKTGSSILLNEEIDVISERIIATLCKEYPHVRVRRRYSTQTYRRLRAVDVL